MTLEAEVVRVVPEWRLGELRLTARRNEWRREHVAPSQTFASATRWFRRLAVADGAMLVHDADVTEHVGQYGDSLILARVRVLPAPLPPYLEAIRAAGGRIALRNDVPFVDVWPDRYEANTTRGRGRR